QVLLSRVQWVLIPERHDAVAAVVENLGIFETGLDRLIAKVDRLWVSSIQRRQVSHACQGSALVMNLVGLSETQIGGHSIASRQRKPPILIKSIRLFFCG